jgi:glycosyltransferase involved in cell wall biosynthesis
MTRTLFISSHAQRGGSERYLLGLLEELPRRSIAGVVSLQDGPFIGELAAAGHAAAVVACSGRPASIVRAAVALRRRVRLSQPDVIHANGIKAALVAGLAGIGLGVPTVWVKHDFSRDGWLARAVARRCSQVIGVSAAVLDELAGRVRVPLHVVPPGILDVEVDTRAARKTVLGLLGRAVDDVAVVTLVGRVEPIKGQRELLEAARTVVARRPRTHFLLAGPDDPNHPRERMRLEERAAELGLVQHVAFAGYRADALDLVAGSDVIVIPSVASDPSRAAEGASFVAIEALALRTPVVAYASGGIPEVLGTCGVLVPPGDHGALADAIVEVLEDRPRRERLTERGRARFLARHRRARMAAGMRDRYLRAVHP